MPAADLPFDEAWYLQTYPDIASAVAAGAFGSGYQHYVHHGRLEGRYPSAGYSEGDRFDAAWYETVYPAAATFPTALRRGRTSRSPRRRALAACGSIRPMPAI
jgi:hypothetical protein